MTRPLFRASREFIPPARTLLAIPISRPLQSFHFSSVLINMRGSLSPTATTTTRTKGGGGAPEFPPSWWETLPLVFLSSPCLISVLWHTLASQPPTCEICILDPGRSRLSQRHRVSQPVTDTPRSLSLSTPLQRPPAPPTNTSYKFYVRQLHCKEY